MIRDNIFDMYYIYVHIAYILIVITHELFILEIYCYYI